ncbi:VOC family protein [Tessaracoccus oleiagri]|uniref:VOC domain-containing protein n=1 Tax=Tessaracoccus oleiagri TaxID=686624 RepID=A0A1G9HQJ1_9ACTN|nr:VOC family protein [Tessaracoccus oleiagri]SDL15066.1 hypothetical protein SAMN04488242_0457 [Tessaracoccus oleiagri]
MPHGDITHLDIPVNDFGKATAFYRDLFGWDIQEYPGFEGYPMWQAPNKVSGGGLADRATSPTKHPVAFVEVDSIDDVLAKATAAGGQIVSEKMPIDATSWLATFQDPDGNVIGLYEGRTDTSEQG